MHGKLLKTTLTAPGVIQYDAVDTYDLPQAIPATVPESLKSQLRAFIQSVAKDPKNVEAKTIAFLRQNRQLAKDLKTISSIIMIATVVEDILTEGVGIADDWVCYLIARTLWDVDQKYQFNYYL
ncbi:hypothetical protein EZ449_09855 [Pedobacter frigidisoli]|uniref:Uncharacterized protein n=1 Tax=Pedobacter frigidisoli TaxID=2530455 RepID=A0A4R0P3D4_9SPHI|nr:hypothetical protein [Pedobacter frigidisoli]TCD10123.1 hypothetical protein EZ449_09855 [Pedobacter frigidisoli]